MKKTKYLNIKGALLDNNSLIDFMEKIAVSYEVKNSSNIQTYPIERLNDNYLFIEKTYNLLNEHIKKGIDIHPAGEWLLDNFYIIEETVKKIKKEMPLKKYKNFFGIANGNYLGFARIYLLASLIVSYRDNIIDDKTIKLAISGYQKQKTLNMEEIWNLWIFLEIALIENIRSISEKIYISQKQKSKVEEIIDRVIENKGNNKRTKFNNSFNNSKNEIKFPFIEYMSYKLKRYGKRGVAYLNVLADEVNKIGFGIEDVITKEHFDIAMQKVLIGNAISSIREISRINFLMLFEEINGVEEILKKDPLDVYRKMDYKTKAYYRDVIKEIATKSKMSENYIASKVLELSKKSEGKKAHVGYYLIDEGYNKLITTLGLGKKFLHVSYRKKVNRYINSIYVVTAFLVILFYLIINKTNTILFSGIIAFLAIIPISEIFIQVLNFFLVKTIRPKQIPKMDFSVSIPEECATIVSIPTILNSSKKVQELMHKLEVYYLANKKDNLYFVLLGDCTTSQNKAESFDKEIIEEGLKICKNLNEKYAKEKNDKFFFLYRNRTWNSGEKSFLGWERKRGLLCEFNEFLVNGNNKFRINTINKTNLKIKYVITLDSDTNLCLDTAEVLIGAMAHVLNTPIIQNRVVTNGHAILQPRVGVNLEDSRKTFFSRIYSGAGGTNFYANAISDVYQDSFGEGIFTGKGIYDLKVFYNILEKQIPENTVLSHDLLEGSYLRAGLVSDVFLLDSSPTKYNSYMARLHRWIRGDFQLIGWLNKTVTIKNGTKNKNPLNKLSKFKILDNLRRSLVPVFSLVLNLIGVYLKNPSVLTLGLVVIVFPSLLDLGNYIVFKKNETNVAYKNIVKTIGNLASSLLRGLLELAFLPNKALKTIDAIIRSIYRLKISKQNLLEWTTSEEVEKKSKGSIISYYKNMKANFVLGIIGILFGITYTNSLALIFGTFWLIAPFIACKISKEITEKEFLNKLDKDYLNEIGKKTWDFFKENINEINNFLPPDNYQEDRKEKVAHRTSPTNIGLRIISNNICL